MDESWRMGMGMGISPAIKPNLPGRRSTEDTSYDRIPVSDTLLDPEYFNDVFGGPPRTVLSRQFSGRGEFSRSHSTTSFFYKEVFRPPENVVPVFRRGGESLPEFRIPSSRRSDHNLHRAHQGLYRDIWEDESEVRSITRSKTSSSSALSSEDLSPLRQAASVEADNDVSFFAPKLRPINATSRWTSTRMLPQDYHKQKTMPIFSGNQPIYTTENAYNENFRNSPFGFCRRNSSPETIILEPVSNTGIRVSMDEVELDSPPSAVSSVCLDRPDKPHKMENEMLQEDETEQEDDEIMSSYVIEINSDHRDGTSEAIGVDEAIAWAKEKFQTHSLEDYCDTLEQEKDQFFKEVLDEGRLTEGRRDDQGSTQEPQDEKRDKCTDETLQFERKVQMELQKLDENIRLWSTGKEDDIRLLLSTLHHILWLNSGWLAIPASNLIKSSQVKKAYQRAQLCLHPDKLQQRGATVPHKYVAEKAFSVLQDAWAAFISRDAMSLKNY